MLVSGKRALLRRVFGFTLLALASGSAMQAAAQGRYPDRPIRLVIPFAPGGETDIFSRAIAARLGEVLGQQIVLENRAGATGIVGSEYVARAKPDGYTLIFGTAATHALNLAVFKTLPYHPLRDFEPIAFVGSVPLVLFVHPSLLKAGAGVTAVHIPYKGTGPALQDTVAGQVQFMGGSIGVGLPMVQAGRLRAVAVMARQRMAAAPEVPTFAEAGMADFEVGTWNVVMAPLGTPRPIIDRLNAALNETLRDPGIRERLTKLGITPVDDSTPVSTGETITREIAKWAKAFELAGGKPE